MDAVLEVPTILTPLWIRMLPFPADVLVIMTPGQHMSLRVFTRTSRLRSGRNGG
jgi:hypothetical protein